MFVNILVSSSVLFLRCLGFFRIEIGWLSQNRSCVWPVSVNLKQFLMGHSKTSRLWWRISQRPLDPWDPTGPPGHEFLAPHRRVLVARTSGQPSHALLPADPGLSQGLAEELQRLHLLLHLQHPEPGAGAARQLSGRRSPGGRRCTPPVPLGLRYALQVVPYLTYLTLTSLSILPHVHIALS